MMIMESSIFLFHTLYLYYQQPSMERNMYVLP